MHEGHPSPEELTNYARDAVSPAVARWIEGHLRTGCPHCQHSIDRLLPQIDAVELPSLPGSAAPEARADDAEWARVFARLECRLTQASTARQEAPALVDEILTLSRGQRRKVLRTAPYRTTAVCDGLIDRSFSEGFSNVGLALELAELALELAGIINERECGRSVLHDLRARAWAYFGNARRIQGDLDGAADALENATRLVAEGTADPLEEGRILEFRASLLCDQGWFEEAAALLDDVVTLCEQVRDRHRKGRALISKGLFLAYAGAPEEAVTLLRRGLALVDRQREPRLVLAARHNLVGCLSDCGRCHEAHRLLASLQRAYSEFPDAWTAIRLRWLEGRIAAGLERPQEAEDAFKEVRARLLAEGMGLDAALAMLDLAQLYLGDGRLDEVRELAREMMPIFLARDVHLRATSALVKLQGEMESRTITAEGLEEIVAYLRRARRNPTLAFRAA